MNDEIGECELIVDWFLDWKQIKLLEVIGSGGCSRVFRAEYKSRKVAVKEFKSEAAEY